MRTKAAVLYDFNQPLRLEEIEVDQPKLGEVAVTMVASGICHTDVSVINGSLPMQLPAVLGHEGAGVVEAIGPGVTKLEPGDHVVIAAEPSCGQCKACLQGKPFQCIAMMAWAFGGTMPDGTKRFKRSGQEISHFFCQSSFAHLSVVPERIAVKVKPEIPLEKLAPLGCGVQTGAGAVLNTAAVQMGESVAVFGCGGVGLSAIMAARLARAFPIVAVDLVQSRLDLAMEIGATHAVNSARASALDEIRKIAGPGVDYAFECVGRTETIRQAVDSARMNGGTAVITGGAPAGSEVKLDTTALLLKNIKGNIEGSSIPDLFIPALIDFWLKGQFPFDRMVSKTYRPEQINQALSDMASGTVIKPVIVY